MSPAPPIICGTMLAAMMAAGLSHSWSIEKFIVDYPTAQAPLLTSPVKKTEKTPEVIKTLPEAPQPTSNQLATHQPELESAAGKEFFESLIQEMRNLRNENKALTDQIAETNRDVMKMQFQIDTHSESFRPLPTSERRLDTSYSTEDDYIGVLPPRAEPVFLDHDD